MKKLLYVLVLLLMLSALPLTALSVGAAEEADTDLLTCIGVSARIDGVSNGLRTLYSIDLSKVAALEEAGYQVEIGAMLAIAEYRGTPIHSFESLTVDAVRENAKNLAAVKVYATDSGAGATYTYVSYTKGELATFAMTVDFHDNAALADADRDKYLIRFVYRGYVILTDKEGTETVLYADPTEAYRDGVTLNDVARTLTEGEYQNNAALAAILEKVGYRVVFQYMNPKTARTETVSVQYVRRGDAAVPPTSFALPDGYEHCGWNGDYGSITSDRTINAILKEKGSWSEPIQ